MILSLVFRLRRLLVGLFLSHLEVFKSGVNASDGIGNNVDKGSVHSFQKKKMIISFKKKQHLVIGGVEKGILSRIQRLK